MTYKEEDIVWKIFIVVGLFFEFIASWTLLDHKPDIRLFGGLLAFGVALQLAGAGINLFKEVDDK